MHEMRSRARGALYGLAIGDAVGMPTQSLSRAVVVARYGPLIGEFCPGPDDHPLAAGLPAGSVTDDTEQAVLLARLVVAGGGEVDAGDLARGLFAWEESMRARGSLDLLGPSTRQALAELAAGTGLAGAGRAGLTNGADAGRPGGIATASRDAYCWRTCVVAASLPTHNTGWRWRRRRRRRHGGQRGNRWGPVARRDQPCRGRRPRARPGAPLGAGDVAARITWATGPVTGPVPGPAHRHREPAGGHQPGTQESVPAAASRSGLQHPRPATPGSPAASPRPSAVTATRSPR
jgi:hypothetical protein